MKKLIAHTSKPHKLRLEIEEVENIGFYLIVYEFGSDQSIADYLQDSLKDVMEEAEERYGILPSQWEKQR